MTDSRNRPDASCSGCISLQDLRAKRDECHSRLVREYAHQLHAIYGGDSDTIEAAAMLCSLWEEAPEAIDENRSKMSVAQAEAILEKAGFPPDKGHAVARIIRELNKPERSPTTTEGRILKDAYLLARFGALGILRVAIRVGEEGGSIDRFLELVDSDSLNLVDQFEFPESQRSALREKKSTDLVVALLDSAPQLEERFPGKYIVLEGNSGVGKDTQAEALRRRLKSEGQEALVVKEPSGTYRRLDDCWKEKTGSRLRDNGSMFRRFLLIADRVKLIGETVVPALQDGINVISVRSYISMLVYQCQTQLDHALVSYLHRFVPTPDLVILYDTSEETCLQRIEKRGTERYQFDRLDELRKYRPLYLDIVDSLDLDCPVETIDASAGKDEVAELTWGVVKGRL